LIGLAGLRMNRLQVTVDHVDDALILAISAGFSSSCGIE